MIVPSEGSANLTRRWASVVLPSPVAPTTASHSPEAAHADALVAQRLGSLPQPGHLGLLASECLHHERAVDALVCDRRDIADPLLGPRRRLLDQAAVSPVE